MKRIISSLLCTVLCLSLFTACASKEDTPATTVPEATTPETTAPQDTAPETTVPKSTEVPSTGLASKPLAKPENVQPITLGTDVSGTAPGGTCTWLSFTTGAAEDSTYQISIQNNSNHSFRLCGLLCDENGVGTILGEPEANKTVLLDAGQLEANTTYYLRLNPVSNEDIEYTVLVTENPADTVIAGSNQTDALLVPLGTKVQCPIMFRASSWFSFTTGNEPSEYKITFVVEPAEGYDVCTYDYEVSCKILDSFGTEIESILASPDGTPATLTLDQLQPNTTYFARIYNNADFYNLERNCSIIVRDMNLQTTAHKTADNIAQALDPEDLINAGTMAGNNANAALPIPYDVNVRGEVAHRNYRWLCFTTGDAADAVYNITVVNETPSPDELAASLYDQFGNPYDSLLAGSDGSAVTMTLDQLEPNTTYYIRLNFRYDSTSGVKKYTVRVTTTEAVEEDPLVFETPFEINETQVQFVGDQAVFVNETKAKEVLKPVADAILAHPDSTILLAGSTATVGTQESCLELSRQRAEAVRNLLVNAFGVPESQMKAVGLGYEADPFERGEDVGPNGQLVESEAVKNRRVVVLDAADPIAQELLEKAN